MNYNIHKIYYDAMGAKIITGQDYAMMVMIILKYYEPPFMLFNSGVYNAGPSKRRGAGRMDWECTHPHTRTRVYNI